MLNLDRIESLLSVSGIAIGSAFDIVLFEHLIASVLNGNLTVIPRV